jgi:hypothetical protein
MLVFFRDGTLDVREAKVGKTHIIHVLYLSNTATELEEFVH